MEHVPVVRSIPSVPYPCSILLFNTLIPYPSFVRWPILHIWSHYVLLIVFDCGFHVRQSTRTYIVYIVYALMQFPPATHWETSLLRSESWASVTAVASVSNRRAWLLWLLWPLWATEELDCCDCCGLCEQQKSLIAVIAVAFVGNRRAWLLWLLWPLWATEELACCDCRRTWLLWLLRSISFCLSRAAGQIFRKFNLWGWNFVLSWRKMGDSVPCPLHTRFRSVKPLLQDRHGPYGFCWMLDGRIWQRPLQFGAYSWGPMKATKISFAWKNVKLPQTLI